MSDVELIAQTVVAMIVIFAVIIFILLARYGRPTAKFDGYMDVSQEDSKMIYQLEITTDPDKLKHKDRIIFKVRHIPPS